MIGLLPLQRAFSLVEILVVIAVIAILSSLVIAALFGTASQASEIVARQQQAELQTALGNWISSESSQPGGLARARSSYNNSTNKLLLLSNYLQLSTLESLGGGGEQVTSSALISSGAKLIFSAAWGISNVPSVNWSNVE